MRFFIWLFGLVPLINATLYIPTTWQDVLYPRDFIWPAKVPQVILDTDHPWLSTNKKWLYRYPNVRSAICNKDSDLWTNPTTPDRALPSDLLERISIDNNKYGVQRYGWKNAVDRLKELKDCPAALESAIDFYIDIFVYDTKHHKHKEDTLPPKELPHLFADVLYKMPRLETLRWGIRPESTDSFNAAFLKANVTLPKLKNLVAGGYSEWLIPRCPNLERLTMGDYFDDPDPQWKEGDDPALRRGRSRLAFLNSTRGLPLQSIQMSSGSWDTTWMQCFEVLLQVQPSISTIEMDNDLYRGAEWSDDPGKLKEHLEYLSRFSNLTSLRLPRVPGLGLGFDGGAWCGNAYEGVDGRAYGRSVMQERAEVEERAGEIVLEVLPRLEQLRIGSSQPNITVNKEGKKELVWPWTGRMREYTYEGFPEIEFDSMNDR
ncbi:hypothetical protein yc1106_08568 [Curvularia clavata]|uniref:Uncharacterized protein n=1 Tax=Curvularia clavata TaxID=95742 RepID=A0A9Q9DWW0_CURCL|nr:hypothetical protein yc1106_08568 [Curvularia clavata]